jgi:hypothetical protein
MTSRRRFIKSLGTFVAGCLIGCKTDSIQAVSAAPPKATTFKGSDFLDWEVALGDGVYAAPGEPEVTINDIETINHGGYSELKANIHKRRIMAHNITFKRIIDEHALDVVHTCGYGFRLPYLPATSNQEMNPQTIEGGLFIWDGSDTRLDYGMAFQWALNPWGGTDFNYGDIRCWTSDNGGSWVKVGDLTPDTSWHTVTFVFDFRRETTEFKIDSIHYPSNFSQTIKPASWGTEIAARLQAEIISLDPGEQGNGTLHIAEYKDWNWIWEPYE